MSGPATDCTCGTCLTCSTRPLGEAVADPRLFRHGAIKERLLSRISSTEVDGKRPLERLGTRDDDDPAIALIDAVARALHVLAWNAARLSDDGSIRRTEDRDALVDLTRMLGYHPRPALAATTTLAFTIDAFDGSPKATTIPKGTKVASVPKQDEKPQIFETDAAFEARGEWNELAPVQVEDVPRVTTDTRRIRIAGASTTAKPGDLILVYLEPQMQQPSRSWLCARIAKVTRKPDVIPQFTDIDLTPQIGLLQLEALRGIAFKNQVVILGQRASAFGATAPDLALMTKTVRADFQDKMSVDWKDLKMQIAVRSQGGTVDLDAVYPDAMADRLVVFVAGTKVQLGRIKSAVEHSRRGFGLSAKVTEIDVEGIDLDDGGYKDKVRETAIYIETDRETLLVVNKDVSLPGTPSDRITVQGRVSLPVGRRIVLSGEQFTSTSERGPRIAEVAILKSSAPAGNNTELVFEDHVANKFRSTTLSLCANAVGASHGDTPATGPEVIGSGAAANPSPRFTLKRSPLAYVPAENARGYAPAIEVRVGDRLYTEAPTLFGLGSEDRVYAVTTGREERSSVQFAGRLPSGAHNVTAVYRNGGGTAGNLAAGRITTVMTPVLGVRSVTNLVAADGGSDAETIDDMRTAAPQSIRTLDRVVSLADFEAFVRTYRGVGKALATELQVGLRKVVCLTIATTTLVSPGVDLIDALKKALVKVTVPGRTIRVAGFKDLAAQVTVALAIDPMLRRANVENGVRTTLALRFGRGARRFGEALHRSAVLAAVHDVEGVVAARLTEFVIPDGPAEDQGRLPCPAPAIDDDGAFVEAGLLSIDADAVKFAEMLP